MGTNKSFIYLIKRSKGKNLEKYLIIPIFFSLFNFSLIRFSEDKFDSNMKPKGSFSSTFATTVPWKIISGWF